jgi:signal transduction histidine kinase
VIRTAEDRVLRTIGLLFGVGGAIFGLLALPLVLEQTDAAPRWWTILALLATVGLPVLLGALAPFAHPRVIRRVAVAVAVGNLLALATTSLVFSSSATATASPWPLQLTALGTTGAALAWSTPLVVADVLLTGALVSTDRLLTESAGLALIPVQDGLYAALFGAVFAALAVGTLRAGRSVDSAAEAAAMTMRAARDERVRSDERARVNGLVHDHVLTTLLVAARSPISSPAAMDGAIEALDQLQRLTEPVDAKESVPATVLLDRLRAQLTAIAPDAHLAVDGDADLLLPPAVVDAVVGAVGEALRNSRRHAGPGAALEVHVIRRVEMLEIAVIDDGRGFDRNAVPQNRLGIAASIIGRTRSVGGTAEVRSHPGRGTAVRICWPAP